MHDKELTAGLQNMDENYTLNIVFSYLSATFGPNISDFLDLCFRWVSVVRGRDDSS